MEMLKKNHRHELGIERARYKETQRQLTELKDTNARLEITLKVSGVKVNTFTLGTCVQCCQPH